MKKEFFIIALSFAILSMSFFVSAGDYDYNYLKMTLLNQDPDPAAPGEYLELRWKIEKEGNNEISDLSFKLDVDYPFYFDESDSPVKYVGGWEGWSDDDEYYTLYYKIRVNENAIEDIYKVKLTANIGSMKDLSYSKEFDIRVANAIKPEFVVGSITTSPTKLLADSEENALQITLENIGEENAQVVSVELELPEGFTPTYGYSTRTNLGTVASDGSAVGTFYVDLDETVAEGEYDAFLNISYKEADDNFNEYKTIQLPIKIPVNGKPMFSIESVVTKPGKVVAGKDIEVLLTIKNFGTKEAESVSVRAFKESSQPFDFDEKSDFIGKLKPGESGEAILKLSIDSDANEKTYLLDVEVRGLYNDEVLTENEVVPLNVHKKNYLVTILVVVAVLALVAVLLIRVKRKHGSKIRKKLKSNLK